MPNIIDKATKAGIYVAFGMIFAGTCMAARDLYILSTPRYDKVLDALVKTESLRSHPSLKSLQLAMEKSGFSCNDPYVEQPQTGKSRVEKMTFQETKSNEEGFVSFRYFADRFESFDIFIRP